MLKHVHGINYDATADDDCHCEITVLNMYLKNTQDAWVMRCGEETVRRTEYPSVIYIGKLIKFPVLYSSYEGLKYSICGNIFL